MEVIRGVPLEQVAAVHAAAAEGFELDEVLAVEELPKQAWFEAELSWKRRIVEQPDVFTAYEEALVVQQERLARRVPPIDEDVEAWVTFLRLYGEQDEPFVWLGSLGLELPDLARLSRHWTARFDGDARLADKATEVAAELEERAADGEIIALDPVTVGVRALVPSAAAGSFVQPSGGATEQHEGPIEDAVPVMGLDRYAALTAELAAVHDRSRSDVLARFGLTTGSARDIDDAWQARLDSDAELRADFRALVRHYEASVERRASAGGASSLPSWAMVPAPSSPAVPPAPPSPAGHADGGPVTAAMPVMSHYEPLPFQGEVSGVGRIVLSLPPSRHSSGVDVTGDLIPALRDEDVLPFASETLDTTGELSTSLLGLDTLPFDGEAVVAMPEPGAGLDEPHDALGLTAKLTVAELGLDEPVLPFGGGDLDGTLASELEGRGPVSLPFDASCSGAMPGPEPFEEPHPGVGATAAFTLDDLGTLEGETLPVDDAAERKPGGGPPSVDAGLDGTAFLEPLELAFDDDASVGGLSPASRTPRLPTLTLDQFASLQAELAVHPERAAAIRARYHLLDEATQRRLEEQWQRRFAASPVERRAFAVKVAEFRRWLSGEHG